MRSALSFILMLISPLFSDPSLVFIHLGEKLPKYLPDALIQARLFNPGCPIYLVANRMALKKPPQALLEMAPILVSIESLDRDLLHTKFLKMSQLDRRARGGLEFFSTERFFCLYELMKKYQLNDVFQLEYDNMLYAEVSLLLPAMQRNYKEKIGATFDHDGRGIAGFMYVSTPAPLFRFLLFVIKEGISRNTDMEFLAQFKQSDGGEAIDHLPVVTPSYAMDHPLVSQRGHRAADPTCYTRHFEEFHAVFDAAALGQYLGGQDPRNGPSEPGFINESSIFDPSRFQYEWIRDEKGRLVPHLVYQNERYPIVNLHIHSKDLKRFRSDR